jgi:signal transduction histidine kinase
VAIDIGIVALVVALLWVLLHNYDVFEEFYEFSRSHEDWDLDEIVLAIIILPIPLLWFAVRRASDSTRAARRIWQIERELSHARKLESLGTLAGGMAHELNNQLQPVLALSELLVTQAGPDDPNTRKYQLINQGAVRARGTVLRVLNFARRDSDQSGERPPLTPCSIWWIFLRSLARHRLSS